MTLQCSGSVKQIWLYLHNVYVIFLTETRPEQEGDRGAWTETLERDQHRHLTVLPPPRTIKTGILKMDTSIINREGLDVSKAKIFLGFLSDKNVNKWTDFPWRDITTSPENYGVLFLIQ